MSTHTYTDFLGNMRVQSLEDPMFSILDGQQKCQSSAEGYAALAMLFIVETQNLGLNLNDVLVYCRNAIAHLDKTDTQKLRALRIYIEREMK